MRAVPWGARQRHAGPGDAAGEAATAEVAQELHRDRTDAGDEPDEVGVAGVEARDRQPGGVVGPSGGELDGVVTRIAVVGRQRVDGDARPAGGGVDERGGALVAEPEARIARSATEIDSSAAPITVASSERARSLRSSASQRPAITRSARPAVRAASSTSAAVSTASSPWASSTGSCGRSAGPTAPSS
jgi:hypothetical protein